MIAVSRSGRTQHNKNRLHPTACHEVLDNAPLSMVRFSLWTLLT